MSRKPSFMSPRWAASGLCASWHSFGWRSPRALGSGQDGSPVEADRPEGVVGDFPEVPIGVGEVAGVAAPVGGLGWPDQAAAGGHDMPKGGVDVLRSLEVDREGNGPKAARRHGSDPDVGGEVVAAPQSQHRTSGAEEADGAEDGRRGQRPAESLVEVGGAADVGDAERDQANASRYGHNPPPAPSLSSGGSGLSPAICERRVRTYR